MKISSFILLLFLLTIGCQSSNPDSDEKQIQEMVLEPMNLPPIPIKEIQTIYDLCDFVDFIFFELPFSMSYDNSGSIKTSLKWVGQETPLDNPNCKALARMIFQNDGEIMAEAEIYVSDQCAHFIWLKDGEPKYANKMTQTGYDHYKKIISQFQ